MATLRAEPLEARAMLAILGLDVLPTGPVPVFLPSSALTLTTDAAVEANTLAVTLSDTIPGNIGKVGAIISGNTPSGPQTRTVWGPGGTDITSITFNATNVDLAGDIVNTVKLTSTFGFDLTSDPNSTSNFLEWRAVADFTPGTRPDVTFDMRNVDVLTLASPLGPTSIAGTFDTPTMIPAAPRGQITIGSNEGITVGASGVEVYDLTLDNNHAGQASAITFGGPVLAKNDLTIRDSNSITVSQPLTAGRDLQVATIKSGGGAGDIFVNAAVKAQAGDVSLVAVADIEVKAPVESVLGGIEIDADDELQVDAKLKAQVGIELVGETKITLTPAADLLADKGSVSLTSANGSITTDGVIQTLDVGGVTFNASTDITSNTKITSAAGNISLKSANGDVVSSNSLLASAGDISLTSTTGSVTMPTVKGAVSPPHLEATAGSVTIDAGLFVEAGKITAFKAIEIDADTNVTLNDSLTVTGAPLGTGLVKIVADAGNLLQNIKAPITVVDGKIDLRSVSGTVSLNSLVRSNLAIAINAARGITLDNAVDLTAAVRTTGAEGTITIKNDANAIVIDAPVTSQADAIEVLNVNDDIDIRDDMTALLDLSVSGKTTVTAHSVPDFVTLTTQTGTLTLASTAANVDIAADVTLVATPGAQAGISLLSATKVTAPIVLQAQGDITIVSPDGYAVTNSMTSNLGSIAIKTDAGPLTSVLTALTAGKNITLEAAGPLTIDNQLTTTTGGINLKSSGNTVSIAPTAGITAPHAAGGTLTIDAGTAVTLGIPVVVGNDVTVTTGASWVPTEDITTTNGSIKVTSTNGNLNVTGITLSAVGGTPPEYGSVSLSAATGTLTVDLNKILLNPGFGDLTLVASKLVGFGGAPYTLGGTLTVQAGNSIAPAAGEDLESLNGDINLRSTGGDVDVSNIDVKATLGSIKLESDAADVIVGAKAFLVSPTNVSLGDPWPANPGDITLRAGGTARVGQSLTAGGTITISSTGSYLLEHNLVSNFEDVSVTSTGGSILIDDSTGKASLIAADVTNGTITLSANGAIDNKLAPGEAIGTQLVAKAMVAKALGASGFLFDNPANDVETLQLTLPTGTGVVYTDIDSLSLSGKITVTKGDVKITTVTGPLTIAADVSVASGDIALESKAGALNVTGDLSVASKDKAGVTLKAATDLTFADVTIGSGDLDATASAGLLKATGSIAVTSGDVTLTSTTGAVEAAGGITLGTASKTGVTLKAGTNLAFADVTIGKGDLSATATAGDLTANGDLTVAVGEVKLSADKGDITINGKVSTSGEIDLKAGAGLLVTGDILAGTGVSLAAGPTTGTLTNGIELNGGQILAGTGDIEVLQVGSVVDDGIVIDGDMTAVLGSISVKTDSNIDFTGGQLIANPIYTAGPPAVGLVTLEAPLGIAMTKGANIIAGRLEVVSVTNAKSDLVLTGAVSTLKVITTKSLTYTNAIPLTLTDFDNKTPSVQIDAFNVSISSPLGLDVIDGIAHKGTLSLSASATLPVRFFPTSPGDNFFVPTFKGTLRDHLNYVSANTAATQPMSVLASLPSTPLSLSGVVTLEESLPRIKNAVLLDGALAPVDLLDPTVSIGGILGIDGSKIAPAVGAHGLTLAAGSSGSHVRNAAIHGFSTGTGIRVESSDNLLEALLIGQDRTGATKAATANSVGIDLSGAAAARNTIGVQTVGVHAGNVIVNSNQSGILVRAGADYTSVFGNFIGTDRTGAALGNGGDGIQIEATIGTVVGGVTPVLGNVIAYSGANGILVQDVSASMLPYGARILGNAIEDNTLAGVRVRGGRNNVIGGAQIGAGNRIEGNQHGIVLGSSLTSVTHSNLVEGNVVANNTVDGLLVEYGWNNTVNGNTFDGNGAAGVRLFQTEADSSVTSSRPSNVVTRNTVTNNGSTVLAGGIVLESASGQVVGGSVTAGLGNEVYGNGGSGIVVLGGLGAAPARLNTIRGNFLGRNAAGTVTSANAGDGIRLQGAITNVITENTVAASTGSGIAIENALATSLLRGNVVTRNSVTGSDIGIRVTGGSRHQIGTTVATEGNAVFGNRSDGIVVERSSGTGAAVGVVVRNNRIGLDVSNAAAGNAGHGIRITDSSATVIDHNNVVSHNTAGGVLIQGGSDTTVGSTQTSRYENRYYRTVELGTPFQANTITLNGGSGITVRNPANPLTPTAITTRVNIVGNVLEQNTSNGLVVQGDRVSGVTIGRRPSVGRPDRDGNQIRHNQGGGVTIDAAQSVTLIGNEIIGNGAADSPQVQLANGANGGMPTPTVTSAAMRSSGQRMPQYDVRGTITGTPRQRFYVDLYGNRASDSRQLYLGRVLVTIGSNGTGTFRYLTAADRNATGGVDTITATATLATTLLGGTSAFSTPVVPS